MKSVFFILIAFVVAVPLLLMLPVGLSRSGKTAALVVSLSLALLAAAAAPMFPFWPLCLLLLLLALAATYLLDRRFGHLLYAVAKEEDEDELFAFETERERMAKAPAVDERENGEKELLMSTDREQEFPVWPPADREIEEGLITGKETASSTEAELDRWLFDDEEPKEGLEGEANKKEKSRETASELPEWPLGNDQVETRLPMESEPLDSWALADQEASTHEQDARPVWKDGELEEWMGAAEQPSKETVENVELDDRDGGLFPDEVEEERAFGEGGKLEEEIFFGEEADKERATDWLNPLDTTWQDEWLVADLTTVEDMIEDGGQLGKHPSTGDAWLHMSQDQPEAIMNNETERVAAEKEPLDDESFLREKSSDFAGGWSSASSEQQDLQEEAERSSQDKEERAFAEDFPMIQEEWGEAHPHTEPLDPASPEASDARKVSSRIIQTLADEWLLIRHQLNKDEYEQQILQCLQRPLADQEYYLLARLLVEHYLQEKEYEKLASWLDHLRERFSSYPILLEEIRFFAQKMNDYK
ncbi:putative sodium/potassium/calcium exchanger [Anoxybacteroides rupiense]|uniref:hypothetical protein n=1 Tax=Anoxybacteroides rupiense TaxID=311460 RepID=UPI001F0917D7|nr:hypothetical protein [Anoxybacillus rupiensis]